MYAVIRTGGKQYHVAPDQILEIEKIAGEAGDIVALGEVLLVGGEGAPQIGLPLISGACVGAQILEQKRGDKIIVFKKKRRQNYRRKNGHRQELTAIRITEILTGGKKPSKSAGKPLPRKVEKFPTPKKSAVMRAEAPKAKTAPEKKSPVKKAPEKKAPEKKAPEKKAAPAKKVEAKKADAGKATAPKAEKKKPAGKKPAAKKPAKK